MLGCQVRLRQLPFYGPSVLPWSAVCSHFARLGVALVAVSGISVGLTATLLRQPPICDASCQNAHRHRGQAHALWNEANSSGGDDRLYSKALEQFQHAYREQSRNLRYSASVGATLNDLGRHQSAIDLLLPISRTSWFAANTDKENKPWFLAELAAAYELIGNTVERDKYLQAATAQSPNLDAWYGNTISRYNQQDAKRLK